MLQSDFLVFDLETDGLLDEVSKIHCMGMQWTHKEGPVLITEIDENPQPLLGTKRPLAGHNIIGYDFPVIKKLHPDFEYPELNYDTLLLSQLCYPRDYLVQKDHAFRAQNGDESLPSKLIGSHSLKAWGYRLKEHKGDFGETTDWKVYTDEMGEYCKQDVAVSVKLLKHFQTKFADIPEQVIKLEHDFARYIREQVNNGWWFNIDKALDLYSDLNKSRQKLEEQLQDMHQGWTIEMKSPEYWQIEYAYVKFKATTKAEVIQNVYDELDNSDYEFTKASLAKMATKGPNKKKHIPFNPGSRDQIARIFTEKYNWDPVEITESGKPKIDESVLKDLPFPEAKQLSEYFEVKKMIGMLAEGNKAWMKLYDPDTHRIYGRVNTLGTRTRRCSHQDPNLAQVPAHSSYGARCRELFGVPAGHKLVGCDASGLELRLLAHYMSKYDGGAYAQEVLSGDIHTKNQQAAGLPTRDNAKTFIYGFIYGAGNGKLGEIVGGTQKDGAKLRKKFFQAIPAIKKLMEDTQQEWKDAKGWLVSIDGAPLFCPSSHACLNTVLQAAGAIIMKKAAVIFWQRFNDWKPDDKHSVKPVGNIHDEIQVQVVNVGGWPEGIGMMIADSIQEAGEYYNLSIPMAGEYSIGDHWGETH